MKVQSLNWKVLLKCFRGITALPIPLSSLLQWRRLSWQWHVHAFHDKNDNNDKVSINLCQSLSWATFQIPCHSCHLCHSAKGNKYIYPLVMNTGSDPTRKWACQWPIGLTQRATVGGYLSRHLICVRGWQYNVWHRGWLMPPRTVKQTEKHLCVLTVNLPHIDCCY